MAIIVDNLTELIGNTPLLRPKTFTELAKLKGEYCLNWSISTLWVV
jgi:cysteine synthase A